MPCIGLEMLLKGSGVLATGSEDKGKRASPLTSTGTTTTVSNSNGKSFRNGKLKLDDFVYSLKCSSVGLWCPLLGLRIDKWAIKSNTVQYSGMVVGGFLIEALKLVSQVYSIYLS